MMYTGPVGGHWEKANLELIRWALETASQGTHHIIGEETGDQELSNTGDFIVDTLKNIDYNTETNAFNVPDVVRNSVTVASLTTCLQYVTSSATLRRNSTLPWQISTIVFQT